MLYNTAVKFLLIKTLKLWTPPPKLSLSEWADLYAYLSPESSAQPGKWQTIPYQKGIMDALTDPRVEKVTVMKSARVGYTKILNHLCGYHIHNDPCNILIVQPTIEDAQGHSKDEIEPMLRDTPCLIDLAPEAKAKDKKNTILRKQFPGMTLMMTGANSARGFRRISARIVIFDEVDGYPPTAGQEGDQIQLGSRRADYFWNKKIVVGSTPTIKGMSRVESSFETSDMSYYHVPCPHCQKKQKLEFANLDFSNMGTVQKPVFICVHCRKPIDFKHQRWMIENGEWISEGEFTGHAGFFIWSAYSFSPNSTWAHIAKEFTECKNDPKKLKTFVNTWLGQTWEDDAGEEIPEDSLLKRLEDYGSAPVPDNVLFLTAAVDTQDDRLECGVIGYGPDKETYWIDYRVFHGDPEKTAVWNELSQYLDSSFESAAGDVHHIACTCIDSGGHFTNEVYFFTKRNQSRRIFAIKGANTPGKPLISRPSLKNKGKVKLFTVGTDTAKEIIHARLKNETPGPSYVHIPKKPCFDAEFVKQLTSEKCVLRYRKGVQYREWVKKSSGIRNEALDIFVYNLAAYEILNPNIGALLENQQKTREKLKNLPAQNTNEMLIPDKKPRSRKRGSGWGKNW
ncbi:MAG TPA: phage terminase large subunit family protein [Spirochaetota bacterium]|nr:phage terminase large subunit family protein [Spirochaetota bacterium]